MRYHLLKHMLSPVRQTVDEEKGRFESRFERDVFQLITDKGFHVRTQVCVGDLTNHRYHIDLVVEGMQGRLAVECDGDEWHGAERYEQDMARQTRSGAGGMAVCPHSRGDFYRDRIKAMGPLWAELDRLGIKPGGVAEVAAEPPPPADGQSFERRHIEEVIPVSPIASDPGNGASTSEGELRATGIGREEIELVQNGPDGTRGHETPRQTGKLLLAKYVSFEGWAGPDPRAGDVGAVVDGLCRIIEVEGPMLAKRAYDIYLRGSGIKRLGGELKSAMNKALMAAIRQGRVISEKEPSLLAAMVELHPSFPMLQRWKVSSAR
jgi:hypothetical protein